VGVYGTTALVAVDTLSATIAYAAGALLCYLIGLTYVAKQENLAEFKQAWPLGFLAVPFVYAATRGMPSPWLWIFPALLGALILRALAFLRARPPRIPRAVVTFIAGISLLDATLAAISGMPVLAIACVVGFGATLAFQRWVSGT
jgi:4-hydroxybenzoate polyprenyltransferase